MQIKAVHYRTYLAKVPNLADLISINYEAQKKSQSPIFHSEVLTMLIPSKLSRPVRLDHTVVRERLLAKLSGANNFRLALITSPAGYGKTTLISQWAAGKSELGWYSLDEGDNQQERFASYLIAAVQQATNGHCTTSEVMVQKRQYVSLTSLFAQLFIELAEWHRPLYLVIDDYHLITNPVIHESMRFFLRHQPENLTLVVLSRNLPQLGIANLRVRDQLLEIGSQQLAFNHQEAKQFFDRRLSSPIEAAESSGCVTMWQAGRPHYSSSPSLRGKTTTLRISRHAVWRELTPAIFQIIWSMKCWTASMSAPAFSC
ncbi:transcriptional regulator MalT [Citrobacter amalonaticus]|nr:transcriptional regulator MalT [Citrobacter amalonaticus]